MKTLYLECKSGISGDMTIGALLDLGIDKNILIDALKTLKFDGYELKFERAKKAGIDAFNFDVILTDTHTHSHQNHDHKHSHEHEHHHKHQHQDHKHSNSHEHRNLHDIEHIINDSKISQKAKDMSIKIFDVIADSEAKAHGIDKHKVHFHEVGAVDSIIDIVGIAVLIDYINPDKIVSSPLAEGTGYIKCAHGLMPVPVPAVLNIAQDNNIPLNIVDVNGEMVTPTGIAVVSAIVDEFGLPNLSNIKQIGYGAGNKNFDNRANILRAFILEENTSTQTEEVILIETNIDDQTPENLAYATQLLLQNNALDVWIEPIMMKKGRAASKLCVLCKNENVKELTYLIFKHTTSIGIRKRIFEREIMQREFLTVNTIYGDVLVKKCSFENIVKHYVEFESAKKAAEEKNVTIQQVIDETLSKLC